MAVPSDVFRPPPGYVQQTILHSLVPLAELALGTRLDFTVLYGLKRGGHGNTRIFYPQIQFYGVPGQRWVLRLFCACFSRSSRALMPTRSPVQTTF